MLGASRACYKALMRMMTFIMATRALGFTFKPDRSRSWDGKRDIRILIIVGKSDFEYAKHGSRKSVNAGIT